MKKNLLFIIGIVVIGIVGLTVLAKPSSPNEKMAEEVIPNTPFAEENRNSPTGVSRQTAYQEYDSENVTQSLQAGKKAVIFFHAAWCPTCKAANSDILENLSQIPEDVVIFKTDYDTSTALKQQYGITTQHTFVYLDADQSAIKKWYGGGVKEILANVQ